MISAEQPKTDVARVGLVTVSYRSGDVLMTMLQSVGFATASEVYGVVVDNAQEDAVRGLAAHAGFHYLALENRGYGAAVNAGIAIMPPTIDWVVISNPDVTFEPDSIDRLLAAGPDLSVGAVGPRILDREGNVYPSARAIPSLRTGIGHALFGRIWPGNPWSRRYLRKAALDSDEPSDAGWLSGSCFLVRRSAFEDIGGFDERYFMYFEDVDLGYRLAKAGLRNVYEPRAQVRHVGGTSTNAHSVAMTNAHHRSASLFGPRKYREPLLPPVRLVLNIGLRMRAAITTRHL